MFKQDFDELAFFRGMSPQQVRELEPLFEPVVDEPLPERLRALAPPPVAVDAQKRPFLARWSRPEGSTLGVRGNDVV